uniref:Uncharacterized protein n=1 Tax=Oryza sativa subsp. japonica TaxID=39947 RepID=Q6EQW5_ORYSJ|nr:hypothetical protein [Oryza sativa Japonica Group]
MECGGGSTARDDLGFDRSSGGMRQQWGHARRSEECGGGVFAQAKITALYDLCKRTFPPPSSSSSPPPDHAIRAVSSLLDTITPADVGLGDDDVDESNILKDSLSAVTPPFMYLHVYNCDAFSVGSSSTWISLPVALLRPKPLLITQQMVVFHAWGGGRRHGEAEGSDGDNGLGSRDGDGGCAGRREAAGGGAGRRQARGGRSRRGEAEGGDGNDGGAGRREAAQGGGRRGAAGVGVGRRKAATETTVWGGGRDGDGGGARRREAWGGGDGDNDLGGAAAELGAGMRWRRRWEAGGGDGDNGLRGAAAELGAGMAMVATARDDDLDDDPDDDDGAPTTLRGVQLLRAGLARRFGWPNLASQPAILARLASLLDLVFVVEWLKFGLERLVERLLEMLLMNNLCF